MLSPDSSFFLHVTTGKITLLGLIKLLLTLIKNGVELTGNSLTDSLKIGEPLSLNYNISDEEKISIQVTQDGQLSTVDVGSELISFTGLNEGQNIVSSDG